MKKPDSVRAFFFTIEQFVSVYDSERMKSDKRYRQAVQFTKPRLRPKLSRRDIITSIKRVPLFALGMILTGISCYLCLSTAIIASFSGIDTVNFKTTGFQVLASFIAGIFFFCLYFALSSDEDRFCSGN